MKISTSQSPTPEEPKNNSSQSATDRQRPLPFYEDDLVGRVRAAREAAQREMEKFGDVSEYEIRKIYGLRTDIRYDKQAFTEAPIEKIETEPPEITPNDSQDEEA